MLFQEIPIEFKEKVEVYLKELFNNIQKIDNNTLCSNNVLYPANITTDHLKLEVGCDKHIETMIELFFLLHVFHIYSKQKQFMYSITAGTILGYLSNNSILPWDDDIDIVVPFSHFKNVEDLWDSSYDKETQIWDKNWIYKNINIDSYNVVLLKRKNKKFFKLKLNIDTIEKHKQYQRDIGGLDIIDENGFHGHFNNSKKKIIFGNDDNYCSHNFCNFEINTLKKEQAEMVCNNLYPRWREMKHPKLFK